MNTPTLSSPTPDELCQLTAAMNSARYGDAAILARALLHNHPRIGFLWKLYGAALLRQGEDALPTLQRAVQFLPDDADVLCDLGAAFRHRGDVTSALEHYRRAIELCPNHLVALIEMAAALHQSERFLEAVESYRRALALAPDVAELHNNLGSAQRDLGELQDALTSYGRALAIQPNFAEAHSNLGNTLRRLGRCSEAVVACCRALHIKPEFAMAHNNLGNAFRDLGQMEEALSSYGRALELDPKAAELHNNLGNTLRDLGRLQDALVSYQRAIELNPALPEAHHNLGNLQLDLMRLTDAERNYRRALAIKPDYMRAYTSLARLLRQQGRAAAAEASCRRALQMAPRDADSLSFLAELYSDRGAFHKAEALFLEALEVQPDLPSAYAGLARCRQLTESDASWLSAVQRLLSKRRPLREEIYLRFALGKYFDDVSRYEEAFQNYYRANELSKKLVPAFDRAVFTRQVDLKVPHFTREWLSRVRAKHTLSKGRPVLIVGMPRSGTSLAEQILASHPSVYGAGELLFWLDAGSDFDIVEKRTAEEADKISGLAQAYLRELGELAPDAIRIVDKMPGNVLHLGLIHAALPDALIIHMCRDPIDTCLSIYFQNFSVAHTYASDLEDLAHYYTEYLRLMTHWRNTLPREAFLDVSYEKLVSDPESSIREMIAFADLPWNEKCLRFHQTDRTVITSSKWQVRQNLSTRSVGRSRHYEAFIGPLRRLVATKS